MSKESLTAISWYRLLSINQKIQLKQLSEDICGFPWETIGLLLTPRERIEVLYEKLKIEGIIK